MKVQTTKYGNMKEVLKFTDHYVGVAIMVSDNGITANSDGKKIVPTGTIVGGSASGEVSAMNDSAAEGVLLRDVNVSHGSAAGTMIVHGFINTKNLPVEPVEAAKSAMPMVLFL